MALAPGSYVAGPADGVVAVQTRREGLAQKIGHDLVIDVTSWEATVEVGDEGVPIAVALRADPRSLRVNRGLHGAKPLTDRDRATIHENIEERVLGDQPIIFRSTQIEGSPRELTVTGELSLAGATRPATVTVALEGARAEGTVTIRQSHWGITPFKAFMGALKVRDDVDVAFDAVLTPMRALRSSPTS